MLVAVASTLYGLDKFTDKFLCCFLPVKKGSTIHDVRINCAVNFHHFLNQLLCNIADVTPMVLCFRVKFYPTEPMKLKEEITRLVIHSNERNLSRAITKLYEKVVLFHSQFRKFSINKTS